MNLFLTPEVLLLAWSILLALVECFRPSFKIKKFGALAMTGVGIVFISTWIIPASSPALWADLYAVDALSFFIKQIILISTFFTLWMMRDRSEIQPKKEIFLFPIFASIGGLLLASATDMVILFVALELVTVALYVLIASQKKSADSAEAGVKYLIVGALSTALFIYGAAILYSSVGSFHFSNIAQHIAKLQSVNPALLLAILLILASVGFKMAAVPFHAWAPDVYQGAPTPVTAFLSSASKAMAFLMLFRIFWLSAFGVEALKTTHQHLFAILAIASLLLGNLAAVPQQNIKRLLGYSSIAHAGFLLAAFSCYNDRGAISMVVYLIAYMPAIWLAFLVINLLETDLDENIKSYSGLAQRSPIAAFCLMVAFVSLAGLPPAAGFFAKFTVLASLWQNGQLVLFIIALLCTLVGLFYYLHLIRVMYCFDPIQKSPLKHNASTLSLSLILAFLILLLGIWPSPLLSIAICNAGSM